MLLQAMPLCEDTVPPYDAGVGAGAWSTPKPPLRLFASSRPVTRLEQAAPPDAHRPSRASLRREQSLPT
jgi:hypothetical protein